MNRRGRKFRSVASNYRVADEHRMTGGSPTVCAGGAAVRQKLTENEMCVRACVLIACAAFTRFFLKPSLSARIRVTERLTSAADVTQHPLQPISIQLASFIDPFLCRISTPGCKTFRTLSFS